MDNIIKVSVNRKEQTYHWHEWMELDLVIKGRAKGIFNNEESDLREGDLWLVNRDVVHSIEGCSDDFIFVQLHFNMEKFNQYIPDIWIEYFKLRPEENDDPVHAGLRDEIRGRIYTIVTLLDSRVRDVRSDNRIIYACMEILSDLRLQFNLIKENESGRKSSENLDRVWRITDYIYDNCNRKLTLGEVAEQEHVSEAYISKILKKETGRNFEESVAYIRAECSVRFLLESDMGITDIAYECGFSAPRYYNAAFRKFFGCTPLEYRKKVANSIKYSDDVSSDALMFQKGVDKEEAKILLQKYVKDSYLLWDIVPVDIDVDAPGFAKGKTVNTLSRDTIICKVDELLRYENYNPLMACRDELGIKKVFLAEKSNGKVVEIAEENVQALDMELSDDSRNGIALSELYDERKIKRGYFYIQKAFNEIGERYTRLGERVVAYKREGALNVLLFNLDGNVRRFRLSFTGKSVKGAYMVKTTTVLEELYEEGSGKAEEKPWHVKAMERIGEKLVCDLRRPKETVELVDDLGRYEREEHLEGKEVHLITLMPIDD